MAAKKLDVIEEAIASAQAKLDSLSGLPPDLTDEFNAIRVAAGGKAVEEDE